MTTPFTPLTEIELQELDQFLLYEVQCDESMTSDTLQQMPADVLEVQNWDDLLEWTLSAIWRIREAKNEASLQDRRDAA